MQHRRLLPIARRHGGRPENTLYAIDKALSNKADAIWITLQLSKDNGVVLYRPSDLKSLTDKSGPVSGYNAAELAQNRCSRDYNQKNKTHIKASVPALDTVLSRYPRPFLPRYQISGRLHRRFCTTTGFSTDPS